MIPNLNEIMEKYVEISEEAALELQTTKVKHEVAQERAEIEAQAEEERKRKRSQEREKEQGEEVKVDDFISERACEVMDKKMLRKDFIGEKGFKQFISPIQRGD